MCEKLEAIQQHSCGNQLIERKKRKNGEKKRREKKDSSQKVVREREAIETEAVVGRGSSDP